MKTYPIVDRIPFQTIREMGFGFNDVFQVVPSMGMPGGRVKGTDITIKAARTGEFREPKKGEWYLSGSIPEAYLAPNDLGIKFHILKLVQVRKIVTETEWIVGHTPGCDAWMKEKGWIFDQSSSGHDRWTRKSDGNTAFRQPFMREEQWTAHKIDKANSPEKG